jgi:hypothetical protein
MGAIMRRIDLRMKIVRLVEEKAKYNKDPFYVGCMVANEIVPFIQNNYRRRKKAVIGRVERKVQNGRTVGNIKISDKMAFQDLHNGPEWHFYGL